MGEAVPSGPTIGSNVEQVVHNNIRFQMWDLGGQQNLRSGWATYYVNTNVSSLFRHLSSRNSHAYDTNANIFYHV